MQISAFQIYIYIYTFSLVREDDNDCVTHRAGGVEYLEHALLAVHLDLLPVGVLDGGVVLLHEDPLHELHRQGGLAHPARPQHHDLVLPHPCVDGSGAFTLKLQKMLSY